MAQAITVSQRNYFKQVSAAPIFLFLDLDVRLVQVCKKWKAEMHALLSVTWNRLPDEFKEAKAKTEVGNYFLAFHNLNGYLTSELRQLDDESPKPFRTQFKGFLTTRRFLAMQQKITAITHARAVWARVRQQNTSLADIMKVAQMSREVANPGNKHAFARVKKLDLREIGFSEIPSHVFNLSALQELNLSHNQLTALPDEIINLRSLVMIDLTGNPIAADAARDPAIKKALSLKLCAIPTLREIRLNDTILELPPATKPPSCSCVVL
jgi:hypothetical protein